MKNSIKEFNETIDREANSLERLRYFCSLALSSADWLNSEELFDDLERDLEDVK